MASQKLSPRQKMINMMYLVLIALLALNVSREILKSFHLFELSYFNANQSIEKRNEDIMVQLSLLARDDKSKARAKEWYDLALETRKISAEFCQYVESVKKEVELLGGGREERKKDESIPELKRPDEMEVNAHYFQSSGKDNGTKLQLKINETREKLLGMLKNVRNSQGVIATLRSTSQLKAIDPLSNEMEKKTWVNTYLVEAPMAGVMTLLSKTQNDCKNLESDVLAVLSENVNINTLIKDGQMAVIIPQSQNVLSGEYFDANIALMSYDTKVESVMRVNGQLIDVKNGIGHIRIPAKGTASHQIFAEIESIDPQTGKSMVVKSEPIEWNSYEGSAAISADNMNVLFFGLENPLSISVPGITPENINVSSTNGIQLRKVGPGKYLASVSGSAREGKVIVNARMQDGTFKSMGTMSFRLKSVPEPKIKFGSLEQGTHERSNLMSQNFIYAVLEDFYFKGVSYKVKSYQAHLVTKKIGNSRDENIVGNSTQIVKEMLKGARSGDVLYFNAIKVQGPTGEIRVPDFSIMIK
ncbi:MAG: gliding motility protein GldM [Bacteroidia bacterium]|nr:gliding motility protein GldM [Bacteroidia bacterium]